MRRIRAAWPLDILDVLALVGLVLLAYGCSLTPPLPWIVTGGLLLIYAFVAALPPRGEP
jgi:hypothetical protein